MADKIPELAEAGYDALWLPPPTKGTGYFFGLQYAGGGGFSSGTGVMYVKSHDDGYTTRPVLHFGLILTRRGLPCVYTEGNCQAETLGESGGAFPRRQLKARGAPFEFRRNRRLARRGRFVCRPGGVVASLSLRFDRFGRFVTLTPTPV